MSITPARQECLAFFDTPWVIGPSRGQPSADPGLLPIRQFDSRIGMPRDFAEVLDEPATWRLLLIKVAAAVIVSCRRIVVRLSGTWPNRAFFERITQHVSICPAGAACWTG